MAHLLKPKVFIQSFDELELDYWKGQGIKGLLLDLDNTIAPWRSEDVLAQACHFVKTCQDKGIKVVLFTNASKGRALAVAQALNTPCVPLAKKPIQRAYRKLFRQEGWLGSEVLTLGDQIFTDTLGGNLAGCTTVLIPPLDMKEYGGTKVLRLMERIIGVHQKPRRETEDASY